MAPKKTDGRSMSNTYYAYSKEDKEMVVEQTKSLGFSQAYVISKHILRNKTTEGNLAKIVVGVYSNGLMSVKKYVLTKGDCPRFNELLCTKFGYNLIFTETGFKLPSLLCIANEAQTSIVYHGIKKEDILF